MLQLLKNRLVKYFFVFSLMSFITAGCSFPLPQVSGAGGSDFRLAQIPRQECYIEGMLCFDIPEKRTDYLKNELLLLLQQQVPETVYKSILEKYGLDELTASKLESLGLNLRVADTNGQDPLELSEKINRVYEDLEAATNNVYRADAVVTGILGRNHPKLMIGANKVIEYTSGEGILIGVIDGPVDIKEDSIRGRIKQIDDLIVYNPESMAQMLHGTSVAGLIISDKNHIGIAPKAQLLSIPAFEPDDKGNFSSSSAKIAQALDLAIKNKVDIINMSFSGGHDSLVEKMVEKALAAGIHVVASCGNDALVKKRYPAALEGVIAVTAVDRLKRPYVKANKGTYIDVAAPGVDIVSIAPGNRMHLITGTSAAAANVSGSLALLMAKKKNIRRDLLNSTATDLGEPGHDASFGDGLINVFNALKTIIK